MRVTLSVSLASAVFLATSAVTDELTFQQPKISGISSDALLKENADAIARRLNIPPDDLAYLETGRSRVIEDLSQSERETYDYFKRFYPGDFEADFASIFTATFAQNYSAAWNSINLDGQGVTMGTGFSHEDVSTRPPSRQRFPWTARLIVDPGNDYAPGGLRQGDDREIKIVFFDDLGQRWSVDLSSSSGNEWQVDTPTISGRDETVALDWNSVARAGSQLFGISENGSNIWVSDDDGATWRVAARNDPAFDDGRKDVMRARGFDDALRRQQITDLLRSHSEETGTAMASAERIESLVWNNATTVPSIQSFRAHPTDPTRLYASFTGGSLGTLEVAELLASGDVYATDVDAFSVAYANEWNAKSAPLKDFSVRDVTNVSAGAAAKTTVRRAAIVLPEDVRYQDILNRSQADFDAWRRDVLDNWGASTIGVFNDDGASVAYFERTSSPDLKIQFTSVTHGGDGQVLYAVDTANDFYYATDFKEKAFDPSSYDLARDRSSAELERARVAFNKAAEEARKADRPIPAYQAGFPTLRNYYRLAQLHWTQLDRDVVGAAGTQSGVWVLLPSGRMRHYQSPDFASAPAGSLRPAADELLVLKSKLTDAIQERDMIADLMRVYLAAIDDTRRLTTSDIAKYRVAFRLEAGGFASKTMTVGGSGGNTGDAILSGVAAVASEVPFAATFLNVANFALGQARAANDTPRTIALPEAAGFTALQSLVALETELKDRFTAHDQAIRFTRQICLASPRSRAACLDSRGLVSQPSEKLKATGVATRYLPQEVAQNVMQSRYIAMVRNARRQARCLAWSEVMPRMGFVYGGAITPGYRDFEVSDDDSDKPVDDGKPFLLGLLGTDPSEVPFMFTKANPAELNNITVATAWTLWLGTKDKNANLVRTALDSDGFENEFEKGPITLPLNGPGSLSLSDLFFTCGPERAKELLSDLDRYTDGVEAYEAFTVNSGGRKFRVPLLAEDYEFPKTDEARDSLISPDNFTDTEFKAEGIAVPVAGFTYYFGGTENWFEDWQLLDQFEKRLE